MNLESPKVNVAKSAEYMFNALSDVKNFEKLMPENIAKFEVIDENQLLPEFLMMEFQRPEFDRRAWTYCDSSVRGGLEWERFCEIQIPIPDIDEQRKFVALYKGLLTNQKTYENSLADKGAKTNDTFM